MADFLTTFPNDPVAHLVLAHGAGAGMTSAFMEQIATALVSHHVAVSRFEFNYMAQRQISGVRRPPSRAGVLMEEFKMAVDDASQSTPARLFIGGKSMGGRIASMIADEAFAKGRIGGLVCLGYPFHPAGRPETLRVAHLAAMSCPALFVQGDRDPLGTRLEAGSYDLSLAIGMEWLADGDHDFKARKASGHSQAGHIKAAAAAIARFVRRA